jgi:hypothetical protein
MAKVDHHQLSRQIMAAEWKKKRGPGLRDGKIKRLHVTQHLSSDLTAVRHLFRKAL